MRWFHEYTGLTTLTVTSFNPYLGDYTATQEAFLIFLICMGILFLPKILALADLAYDRPRRRAFGGLAHAAAGAVGETLFSALHAPLQMLWHTRFVVTIVAGMGVNWGTQNRSADGTDWLFAIRRHWGHTLIGLGWGYLVWELDRATFWWFVPVLAGMAVSIPLSVLTSRGDLGRRARDFGLFLTPEETAPPPELVSLLERMTAHEITGEAAPRPRNASLTDAVLDPYVNAIHVSLLREKRLNPDYAEAMNQLGAGQPEVRALGEKLLKEGPEALQTKEKLALLADSETVSWLHRQAWVRPPQQLHIWWQRAIRRYAR